MGKKGNGWFSSVKKVFSKQPLNHNKDYYSPHHHHKEDNDNNNEAPEVVSLEHYFPSPDLTNDDSAAEDPNHEAISVALVTAAAAAQAAAEVVVRLAGGGSRQSKADRAATRIQSYYRGYLARRALRALKALVRLQALARGNKVRKKALTTMRCMQSLVRVQGRMRAERAQITNDNKVEPSVEEAQVSMDMESSLHLLEERMRKLGKSAEKKKLLEEDDDDVHGNGSLGTGGELGDTSWGNHYFDSEIRRERSLAFAAFANQDQQQELSNSVANAHHHHHHHQEWLFGNEEPQWRRRSWLEGWRLASSQAATESPPPRHGSPSPTTLSTADELSEKRVEIDFSGKWLRSEPVKPTRHNNLELSPKSTTCGHRRASVPSFMAPTQSAKAKARAQARNRARDAPSSAQWNSSTKSGSAHHPLGSRSLNPKKNARQANNHTNRWMPSYCSPESSEK